MQRARSVILVIVLMLLLISCGRDAHTPKVEDRAKLLAGTWVLTSKAEEGKEEPVSERLLRLVLTEEGTFRADYRGDASQKWIVAGQGGVSFVPPVLRFFWDSGNVTSFLVLEQDADRLRLHHGVNLAPLKDQAADEIYRIEK